MELMPVRPTWRLTWGLWWRTLLLALAAYTIIGLIVIIVIAATRSGPSEQVEVSPNWRLAWGLMWRMFLINLALGGVIGLIMLLIGVSLIPF